jgi:hypothetical protein
LEQVSQEKRGKNLEILEDGETTSETTQTTQATGEREPKGPKEEHQKHIEQQQFQVEESLHLFWPRCAWLAAMLLVQSLSSFLELVDLLWHLCC